jgi:predicted  nucleic acid-binding Zn ribbon protein
VQKRQTSTSRCDKCGSLEPPIFVHGHYQCQNCRCITDGDCCQGAPL